MSATLALRRLRLCAPRRWAGTRSRRAFTRRDALGTSAERPHSGHVHVSVRARFGDDRLRSQVRRFLIARRALTGPTMSDARLSGKRRLRSTIQPGDSGRSVTSFCRFFRHRISDRLVFGFLPSVEGRGLGNRPMPADVPGGSGSTICDSVTSSSYASGRTRPASAGSALLRSSCTTMQGQREDSPKHDPDRHREHAGT
jgi:hypothetical protein